MCENSSGNDAKLFAAIAAAEKAVADRLAAQQAEAETASGQPIPDGWQFTGQVREHLPRALRKTGAVGRVIGWTAERRTPEGRHTRDSWGAENFYPSAPPRPEPGAKQSGSSLDAGEAGNEDAAWGSSSSDGWRVD